MLPCVTNILTIRGGTYKSDNQEVNGAERSHSRHYLAAAQAVVADNIYTIS